jgi:MoaA/NifB/PqqE/SkfB family radical SAM enzyme
MSAYSTLYDSNKIIAWVDLSTYCNALCPQCHRTNPEGLTKADWLPLVQWSLEDFQRAFPISQIDHYDRFDICGTWGDPIMNKDIFEICKYILHESNSHIHIFTNGSIRDAEWWWDLGVLSRLNQERIKVTFDIDGISEEQHQKYRRNTSLKKVLDNMLSFTSAGATSSVFTVVFKHNQNDLYNIAMLCKDYGASSIGFAVSNRFHNPFKPTSYKFKYNNNSEFLFKTTKYLKEWFWLNLDDKEKLNELYNMSMDE